MYRSELCIVGGGVLSAAPSSAGKEAVRGLYIITAPEGTASRRRARHSGASWCRVPGGLTEVKVWRRVDHDLLHWSRNLRMPAEPCLVHRRPNLPQPRPGGTRD